MLDFGQVPKLDEIKSHYPHVKAALWDMDGTLFETETIHMDVMVEILGFKPPFTQAHLQLKSDCVGLTDDQVLTKLHGLGMLNHLTHETFVNIKNHHFAKALVKYSMDAILLPTIHNLLHELKSAGIKLALVTSSERETTDLLMKKSGYDQLFEFTITKQDVQNPKPNPEPYLMAMKKLAISPKEVIIFEDSSTGLAAAKASGANIIKACWYNNP